MSKRATKTNQNPVATVVFAVLPMADILKLSIKEACARFAERATITQRAFAEMGKLHHAISSSLKKGQTIYGELRKVGVKDSTISNASYASRVFDLVAAGHLTEAEFDGFTFADCLSICRAMGKQSKRPIGPEEVAVILRAKPQTFDLEFTSIYETGLTVEEAEAQARAEADRLAAEQAAATAAAAEKAEAEKQAAVAAAVAAAQQTPPAPAANVGPASSPAAQAPAAASVPADAPAPAPDTSIQSTPYIESATEAPANPTNVTSIPDQQQSADPDATLPEILAALDELSVSASNLSLDAKKAVFAKLNDCLGFIGEQITEAERQAA